MRLNLLLFATLFVVSSLDAVEAAARPQPPYSAVVNVHELFVRSGPGKSFYPTRKLERGERVRVLRHDYGGWYMIELPKGAFSWIRADDVRVAAANSKVGTVIANNVAVRTGSVFGDDRDVWQEKLNKNARVTILGEKTFEEEGRRVRMYKIASPRGEHRWIDGSEVIPEGQAATPKDKADPFVDRSFGPVAESDRDNPFNDKPAELGTIDRGNSSVEERPVVRVGRDGTSRRTTADTSAVAGLGVLRRELGQLDDALSAMMQQKRERWDFGPFREEYGELLAKTKQSGNHGLASQIDWRLRSVERHAKLNAEYLEFMRLANATKQRDREILSISAPGASSETTEPEEALPAAPPREPAAPDPRAATRRRPREAAGPSAATVPRKFVGAGIVQHSATSFVGAPRYVLLAPTGRILAYLNSRPGINLEPAVGKPMGIYGTRGPNRQLQSDLIDVTGFSPVRLVP